MSESPNERTLWHSTPAPEVQVALESWGHRTTASPWQHQSRRCPPGDGVWAGSKLQMQECSSLDGPGCLSQHQSLLLCRGRGARAVKDGVGVVVPLLQRKSVSDGRVSGVLPSGEAASGVMASGV
jgi:hypothetical protein